MNRVDLTNSSRLEIPYINEDEAKLLNRNKGWTLSYTYYFSEIRDVYIALRTKGFTGLEEFTNYCLSVDLPFVRTQWNKRRILEHLNALINFSLIDTKYKIIAEVFNESKIGDSLSSDDLNVFYNIYFSYFRFREIFSWFVNINPISRLNLVKELDRSSILNSSIPLYAFSEKGKFMDSFFCELRDYTPVYYIRHKCMDAKGEVVNGNEDLMRFWDMFIKWGTELGVVEKFSLRDLGLKTSTDKNIICCYIINNDPVQLDLLEYINKNFAHSYIYLPELTFKIATAYRLSIKAAHELIIQGYKVNKENLSFERTSEVFIRGGEIREQDKILFPKFAGSYISHLVVRK